MNLKIVVAFLAPLIFFSFSPLVQADEITITITGGIGYRASVYNPGPDNITMNVSGKILRTGQEVINDSIICCPDAVTSLGRIVFGLSIFSMKVWAGDKTASRNGVVLGPFVIFGKYQDVLMPIT